MSGQAQVGDYGNVTTTTVAGGAAGAQLYQSAAGTTSFAYPDTSVASFYLDGTRTDSYTPNGTALLPYTTLTQLVAGVASATGPLVIYCAPSTYAYTGNLSFPTYQMTIFGNGSSWNITGTVTANGPTYISNLFDTATAVNYAYTGTTPSTRIGGSLNTALTISGSTPQFINLYAMGTITVTGGQPFFNGVTGTATIVVNGASAFAFFNNLSLSMATAAANITVTNGQLSLASALLTNSGTVANVVFNNTNTNATPMLITNLDCNYGVAAGSAYTYVSPDSIIINLTGTNIMPSYGVGLVSPAATALNIKSGTTGVATFDSGTTGAVNIGTSSNVKAVTIGNATSGSKVDIYGEIDGGAVGGGYIGQVLSTLVPIGSAVSLTTATPANAVGIALSAGDWDVEASLNFSAVSATIALGASFEIGLSTVSVTLPTDGSEIYLAAPVLTATSAIFGGALPRKIFRPTGSSNVYVVVNATFTAGTVAAYGSITARRAH